jgi:hypothetical protein
MGCAVRRATMGHLLHVSGRAAQWAGVWPKHGLLARVVPGTSHGSSVVLCLGRTKFCVPHAGPFGPAWNLRGWGSCLQLLEITQGLDQLLSNQLFCFTSKQDWRMDFSSGRVLTGIARGCGCASLCVRSLTYKECLKQHRVHHPLTGSWRWAAQVEKNVIDRTIGIYLNVWWCRCSLWRTIVAGVRGLSVAAIDGGWITTRSNHVVLSKTIEAKSLHLP